MKIILLTMSFALSCAPSIQKLPVDYDSEANANNDLSEDQPQTDDTGVGGNDDNNESEEQDQAEDSDNSEGSTSNRVINDGIWSLTETVLVDDPCDWLELIPTFGDGIVAVSLETLLPERFDVEAMDDSFKIKAKSYRARDFIECNVDNSSFTCETQTAGAARYYFDGFIYSIDFTGTVIDNNSIQGVAVVRYSIDDDNWWVDFIENYVDNTEDYISECTQTLELTIDRNE
jgi:hypothetical protein